MAVTVVAALCAGYGGLEMGLALALDDQVEVAWWAETNPHAATVMAAHHPHAPNLGDLTRINNPPPADIVTAGFPCQPVSQAGLRAGIHDQRWLINDICDLFRRSGAHTLILENVPGLLSANDGHAMARVCEALARVGLDAKWTVVRASDVGACHRRARWFCVATHPMRVGPGTNTGTGGTTHHSRTTSGPSHSHSPATHPDSVTTRRHPRTDAGPQSQHARRAPNDHHRPTDAPPNPPTEWGPYTDAVHHHATILGRPAPQPLTGRALNARFVEWMMMLPDGHVTGHLPNRHALHVLGNGVVPQQAAAAIRHLLKDRP